MKTSDLFKSLSIAKPSLGSEDGILPILSHFCFCGDIIYAYNDVTAIVVDQPTGLDCALHGSTLLGVLEACGEEEAKIEVDKQGTVKLNTGKNWIKIPSLPTQDSAFTLPDEEPIITIPLTPEVLTAIERCLISVSNDSLKPEFAGITVQVEKSATTFFSSDNLTAARYRLDAKFITRKNLATVLPAQACEQLLKLCSTFQQQDAALAVGEKVAIATFNGATLITRLLPAKPDIFASVFGQHADEATFFVLPEGLGREIAKAVVLTVKEQVKECYINAGSGSVKIDAGSSLGNMESTMPVDKKLVGGVNIDPMLISRALPYLSKWAINDGRSLTFSNGPYTYIISSAKKREG